MKRGGAGEAVEIDERHAELDDVVDRRDRRLRASDAVPGATSEPLDLGVARRGHVHRQLALGTQPGTNAEVALVAQERLPTGGAIGVDADRDMHFVRGGDVRHAHQAVERGRVSREPDLDEIVVGGHAGVGAPITRDASHDPLVPRRGSLMATGRRHSGPVHRVAVDHPGTGNR